MANYIIDLVIVAILVIGITAINGAIGDVIGRKIFAVKTGQCSRMQQRTAKLAGKALAEQNK